MMMASPSAMKADSDKTLALRLLVVQPKEKPKKRDASAVVAALEKQMMSLIKTCNKR